MKKLLPSIVPHLIAVALFIALSFAYFSPVIKGKVLHQMDGSHATGMAKELVDFEKATGEKSAWTNSAFCGMPAYQIKGNATNNIFWYLNQVIHLYLPYSTVAILFIYLIGFYVLLSVLKFNPWLSIAGAIAFAFASYNIIIIDAGHVTKAYAIGLMAPVLAGIIITYQKKYLAGGLLTAVALGLQITVNHVQITYYVMLMVVLLGIYEFIIAIREKALKDFAKATAILVVASFLGVLPNIANLWTTYEYGKESIRGKSDLTAQDGEKEHSGLDKEYALSWSYGITETLTLMIPNAVGGASQAIGDNEKALKDVSPDYTERIAQQTQYWGSQPFTSGPVYVGAIVCFLFILGMFIVKNPLKWWIFAATILSIFLAWGYNFMPLTDFFFYHVPMYNKFRTVAMTLVIAGVTMPLMAMMTIKELIENPEILKINRKPFYYSLGLSAGLLLVFYMMPSFFSYITEKEQDVVKKQKDYIMGKQDLDIEQKQQYMANLKDLLDNLEKARVVIFKADVLRSLIFVLLAAGLIFLFSLKIIKKEVLIASLAVLILIDLWSIDKRYLSDDKFMAAEELENEFTPSGADMFILKDKDVNFRVFNITTNTFNDAYTPYFHKSLGGYHGAKLRRYQDLIDKYLSQDVQFLQEALSSKDSTMSVYSILAKMNVVNMLNTRYVIFDPKNMPLVNMNACGNAWFVNNYKVVENADAELDALQNFNPTQTAIIDKKFAESLPKTESTASTNSKIVLKSYKPNELVYQANASREQLAVFSEIYYNKGWNAYIDGKLTPHIRVNYVLRALAVPAGEHKIEFKFEPVSYNWGQRIALISSLIVFLLLIGGLGKLIQSFRKDEELEIKEPVQEQKHLHTHHDHQNKK